jgi:hypothetical protein
MRSPDGCTDAKRTHTHTQDTRNLLSLSWLPLSGLVVGTPTADGTIYETRYYDTVGRSQKIRFTEDNKYNINSNNRFVEERERVSSVVLLSNWRKTTALS